MGTPTSGGCPFHPPVYPPGPGAVEDTPPEGPNGGWGRSRSVDRPCSAATRGDRVRLGNSGTATPPGQRTPGQARKISNISVASSQGAAEDDPEASGSKLELASIVEAVENLLLPPVGHGFFNSFIRYMLLRE